MESINNTINSMTIRKPKENYLNIGYFISIVGSLLLSLSTFTGSSFFILILFALLPIGLVKPLYLIPIYYVSSLSSQYFMAAEGLGITRLFTFSIFIGILLRILLLGKKIENYWIRNLIYIGIATLFSYVFGNQQFIQSLYIVGMNLLILFTFANIKQKENELEKLFKSIYLSVVIISISIIINAIFNPVVTSGRTTIAENLNVNTFSIMCAQLGAFLIGYALYTQSKQMKFISYTLALSNTYLILLSGSRTAFIAISVGTLISLLVYNHKQKRNLKGIILVGIVIFVGCLVFIQIIEQNPVLAYRFNIESILLSGGTGRWDRILAEVKYVIPNNLFFGVGPISLNETIALQGYTKFPGSSHNILISMLTQVGIIGSLGYILIVKDILKKILRILNSNKLPYVPLCLIVTGVINGIGEVVYHERFFWSALSLGVLCIESFKFNLRKSQGCSSIEGK